MSESISTTIRMDAGLKSQFDQACASMGLNFSTAINIFATKVVQEQKIPFEISASTPNPETQTILENIEHRRHLSRPFHSVHELMESLNADD